MAVYNVDDSKSCMISIETLTNGKFMFVVSSHGCPMNNGKQYDDVSLCFDAAKEFILEFLSNIRFLDRSEIWHNTK